MAKHVGPFKFRGMLDETMFRITEDGNIAGRKSGPSREKVLTHENFDRTRRNASEFQMAIGDAARLRYALSGALKKTGGSSLNGRMNGLFNIMLQDDPVNDLGSRRACNGNVSLLNGFDLNKHLSLTTVKLPFTHSLNASTGECWLNICSFIARKKKVYPKAATHFRMVSGCVSVNFLHAQRKVSSQDIKRSYLLPLGKKTAGNIIFDHRVQVQECEMLVQVLGIEFYKLVKGNEVLVKGGPMQVVEAVKAVQGQVFSTDEAGTRQRLIDCDQLLSNDCRQCEGAATLRHERYRKIYHHHSRAGDAVLQLRHHSTNRPVFWSQHSRRRTGVGRRMAMVQRQCGSPAIPRRLH